MVEETTFVRVSCLCDLHRRSALAYSFFFVCHLSRQAERIMPDHVSKFHLFTEGADVWINPLFSGRSEVDGRDRWARGAGQGRQS